jgi:aspartate-semialdehyde dehydrogenase
MEKLLEDSGVDVRRADVEPVSNADIAGQSGIAVSDIAEDRGSARGMWFWLGSDNVLTHAENALLTAGMLSRKGGK